MQIFQSLNFEVAELIKSGAVGIIPTDTIYGITTSLLSADSVERIYNIKQRPTDKRIGTTLISNPAQLTGFVDKSQLDKASSFWPGTSVELRITNGLEYAHRGNQTLAFRLPIGEKLQNFIDQTGPIVTTSVNYAGDSAISNINDAIEKFGEELDFYVDVGELNKSPSRIIKINDDGSVKIIRS